MATIADNLQAVRARIARAAQQAGRDPAAITLLAASKAQPAAALAAAVRAGQTAFGENYVQEALDKMAALQQVLGGAAQLEWHMIGPLQANKTRAVAEHFDWVHSVDRERIAQRLSEQRPPQRAALDVLLQVNVSGETSKSGVAPRELPGLARAVARLPRLRLRGLMAIPEPSSDVALQRARFRSVRELYARLCEDGFALDTLSLGMSADLEAAIAEGATLVRVGTAIFGARAVRRRAPAAGCAS